MNILFLPKMNIMYIITSSTNNGVNEMKMSEPEFEQFNQITEKVFQAQLVCSLMEDHPQTFSDTTVSALASLLKQLTGDVYVYMREIAHQLESSK